ncbi:hypothetical protein M3Y99_01485700 [Aphelenchoides fujianensis]|nr:hypothetical protein M3Y99_01485700 [Aphelenchoides fujianensis]
MGKQKTAPTADGSTFVLEVPDIRRRIKNEQERRFEDLAFDLRFYPPNRPRGPAMFRCVLLDLPKRSLVQLRLDWALHRVDGRLVRAYSQTIVFESNCGCRAKCKCKENRTEGRYYVYPEKFPSRAEEDGVRLVLTVSRVGEKKRRDRSRDRSMSPLRSPLDRSPKRRTRGRREAPPSTSKSTVRSRDHRKRRSSPRGHPSRPADLHEKEETDRPPAHPTTSPPEIVELSDDDVIVISDSERAPQQTTPVQQLGSNAPVRSSRDPRIKRHGAPSLPAQSLPAQSPPAQSPPEEIAEERTPASSQTGEKVVRLTVADLQTPASKRARAEDEREVVTIKADGHTFRVDKRRLAAEWTFFARLVEQKAQFDPLEVGGVDRRQMAAVVAWIERKEVECSESNVYDLYVIAKHLEMPGFKTACIEAMKRGLTDENRAAAFVFAVHQEDADLLRALSPWDEETTQKVLLLLEDPQMMQFLSTRSPFMQELFEEMYSH